MEIRLETLRLVTVLPVRVRMDHVQGIDVEGNRLWISSVDRQGKRGLLHLVDLPSGLPVREIEVHEGARYHPGGISLDGGAVWVPVAEYRKLSSAMVERRDKETLEPLGRFEVDDHIGCAAADGKHVYGGNWDSEIVYRWTYDGEAVDERRNPAGVAYQDMQCAGDALIASGNLSPGEGAIDWLDKETLELRGRIRAGTTSRGARFTNEGMAFRGGRLYLLPEDGPSRLFIYDAPAGWKKLAAGREG